MTSKHWFFSSKFEYFLFPIRNSTVSEQKRPRLSFSNGCQEIDAKYVAILKQAINIFIKLLCGNVWQFSASCIPFFFLRYCSPLRGVIQNAYSGSWNGVARTRPLLRHNLDVRCFPVSETIAGLKSRGEKRISPGESVILSLATSYPQFVENGTGLKEKKTFECTPAAIRSSVVQRRLPHGEQKLTSTRAWETLVNIAL